MPSWSHRPAVSRLLAHFLTGRRLSAPAGAELKGTYRPLHLEGAPPSFPYRPTMVWESKYGRGEVSGALVFFVFACILPTKIVRVAELVVVFCDFFVLTMRRCLESLATVWEMEGVLGTTGRKDGELLIFAFWGISGAQKWWVYPHRNDWWLNFCLLLRDGTPYPPPSLDGASDRSSQRGEDDSNVCLLVFARLGHKSCFVCHDGMVAGLIFVFWWEKAPQISRHRSNAKQTFWLCMDETWHSWLLLWLC